MSVGSVTMKLLLRILLLGLQNQDPFHNNNQRIKTKVHILQMAISKLNTYHGSYIPKYHKPKIMTELFGHSPNSIISKVHFYQVIIFE